MKQVKQVDICSGMNTNDVINELSQAGVMGGGRIARAVEIFESMAKDKDCKIFFGLAGAMVPGGMKNIIIDMLKSHLIDVLVVTGANITHDMVEALGYHHYQGSPNVSDKELNEKKIDRIYDSFMPNDVYEGLENFFAKHFDDIAKDKCNIKEFLWKIGGLIPADKQSILRTCFEEKIPIFCPAISDSGIGLMIWGNLAKGKSINVGAFDDMKEILSIAWDSKKSAVFYVGGGVPKNYIQQAMQFSPNAAEYGVQITMDRPEPGGSSGAELREGISWGKMSDKGSFVDVICDATIALPIIYAALKERLK
jgi:deoxyhypusine synthase